jgi:hypothetical protein
MIWPSDAHRQKQFRQLLRLALGGLSRAAPTEHLKWMPARCPAALVRRSRHLVQDRTSSGNIHDRSDTSVNIVIPKSLLQDCERWLPCAVTDRDVI